MVITSALTHLRQQLLNVTQRTGGFLKLAVPLPVQPEGLEWLGAQRVWPQFYWQQREGAQTLIALGDVRRANTVEEACDLLATLPEPACLVGANAFDLHHSDLFLPRLLWDNTSLSLFLYSETSLVEDAQAVLAFLDAILPARPLPPIDFPRTQLIHHPDFTGWRALVENALAAIRQGEMEKVVLARTTDIAFTQPVSPPSLLAASRAVNHRCYHFMLAREETQAFIGSSPERLYHRVDCAVRSEALAGTCARPKDDRDAERLAQALLNDGKNRRENGMVVEDICQRLQPIAVDIDVSPVAILPLRNVQHLIREITCQLRQPDDRACIHQLQPTAAVAGLPRQPARHFIHQQEPFSRENYAGSVGYLTRKESEFTVALRSAQVTQHGVRLYAGAGIVAGSEPALEWQEINQKAASLASLLGVEISP